MADREALLSTLRAIAAGCTGELGVAARHIDTGEDVLLNGEQLFPTASVIKAAILVELFRRGVEGTLSLDERVPLTGPERIGGSGVLKLFDPGLEPTLRDIATLMVAVSDNTATNFAIDTLGGVEAVNTAMAQLGLPDIRLHNRIDFELIGPDVRRLAEAPPAQLCALMHAVATGTAFGPAVSRAVEDVLSTQQYLDQVPRYLRINPYWRELGDDPALTVACKTGFFTGTRVDAGIVRFRDGGGFAYAVANHGTKDESFAPEAEGSVVNGLVGKALTEYWWPSGPAPTLETAHDVLLNAARS